MPCCRNHVRLSRSGIPKVRSSDPPRRCYTETAQPSPRRSQRYGSASPAEGRHSRGSFGWPRNHRRADTDLHSTGRASEPRPLVVYFHGGGWSSAVWAQATGCAAQWPAIWTLWSYPSTIAWRPSTSSRPPSRLLRRSLVESGQRRLARRGCRPHRSDG